MANMPNVNERPRQQPQVKPQAPLTQSPTAGDLLAGLSGKKYLEAMTAEAEGYLLSKGWTKEGFKWRQPCKAPAQGVHRIELPPEGEGKQPVIIEQLVLPAMPWLYQLPQALAMQQASETKGS